MGRRTPQNLVDPAGDRRLRADVAELATSILDSAAPPPGFIRWEIPVGGTQASAYAGVSSQERGGPATIVVVINHGGPTKPDRRALQRRFGLTPREAEVAVMLAARRSNKEIAAQLSIAQKTAWGHTERVLSKLNVSSRLQVRRVLESGMPS
jgi:DNA-binding CsgD family transcriptional regulator